MKRRGFVRRVAATTGVAVVGGAVVSGGEAQADEGVGAPTLDLGLAPGFKLLSKQERWLTPDVRVDLGAGFNPEGGQMTHYKVRCPYPVGDRAWIVIADLEEGKNVFAWDGYQTLRYSTKLRRVLFPRLRESDFQGGTVHDQALKVLKAVREDGFDGVKDADPYHWQIVHVEYQCPDGVEHVLAGIPLNWDPALCLEVMVKGQILGEEGRQGV